eukprot:gene6373-10380_t
MENIEEVVKIEEIVEKDENNKWKEIRDKLVEDVELTLNTATDQSSHRRKQTLTSLFQDLGNKIKKKIQKVLNDDEIYNYYQIFANFYEENFERGEKMEKVSKLLSSNHYFPSIYALLFYKWLFTSSFTDETQRKLNLLLLGANRLFWSDIENRTFNYREVYYYLKNCLLQNCKILENFQDNKPSQDLIHLKIQDLIAIVLKYYFYYHKSLKMMDHYVQKLTTFYCKEKEEKEQLSFLIYDVFVRENHTILNSLQHEELILKILLNLQNLDMEKITSKSKIKLQDTIYSLTRPGPPVYPTRIVRKNATSTLDILFPGGKIARFLLSASFRIFHHFTWPKSALFWAAEKIWSTVTYPYSSYGHKKHLTLTMLKLIVMMNLQEPMNQIQVQMMKM